MGNASFSGDSTLVRPRSMSNHELGPAKRFSPHSSRRKRFPSTDSMERDDYGWFEDFESPSLQKIVSSEFPHQPLQRALTLPQPAAEPPMYVLESSLETQQLWYTTAGQRPKQPDTEREYFEKLWSQNFEASAVRYSSQETGDSIRKKTKTGDVIPQTEINGEVVFRGKSPFSHSVSKSFPDQQVTSMTMQMPFYRICRSCNGEIYAEFLVQVSLGGRGSVTFGIWKRHSDFSDLAKELTVFNLRSGTACLFKNALLSWQCVLQRKKWFKSLDKEYLALKCFLIERFMHDLLFESVSPNLISKFLGLE